MAKKAAHSKTKRAKPGAKLSRGKKLPSIKTLTRHIEYTFT